VILAVGVIDIPPEIPGLRAIWGHTSFQCPYCHGWENRDRRFGVVVTTQAHAEWAPLLLGWSKDLVAFTEGNDLSVRGARTVRSKIARVLGEGTELRAVELEDGERIERDVLFIRPLQRQVPLIEKLGLALDDLGYVKVDDHKESSMPGVHVVGDSTTQMQGALLSAADGNRAAFIINHALAL
jgi:thioredoxin reductase